MTEEGSVAHVVKSQEAARMARVDAAANMAKCKELREEIMVLQGMRFDNIKMGEDDPSTRVHQATRVEKASEKVDAGVLQGRVTWRRRPSRITIRCMVDVCRHADGYM